MTTVPDDLHAGPRWAKVDFAEDWVIVDVLKVQDSRIFGYHGAGLALSEILEWGEAITPPSTKPKDHPRVRAIVAWLRERARVREAHVDRECDDYYVGQQNGYFDALYQAADDIEREDPWHEK